MDNELMRYFFDTDGSDSDDDFKQIVQNTNEANALFLHSDVGVAVVGILDPALDLLFHERRKASRFEQVIVPMYNETEFLEAFRLRRKDVINLISRFEETAEFRKLDGHGGPPAISPEKHILAFLRFVGNKEEHYRDIAQRFGISLSSMHGVIGRVLDFILSLGSETIKWPTIAQQNITAAFFKEKYGVPNIIGGIDGIHICIDKPLADSEKYLNSEDYHSVHIQAIVNENLKFIDVFIGCPGSMHDTWVFKQTQLYTCLSDMCYFDHFLIGDNAYPCLQNLFVPYRDYGNLSQPQTEFNTRLNDCLSYMEGASQKLKQRFRQLKQLKVRDVSRAAKIINACCILHNLASSDDFEILNLMNEETIEKLQHSEDISIALKSSSAGLKKRDDLSMKFQCDSASYIF